MDGFTSSSVCDQELPQIIKQVMDDYGYLVDPHTACAFKDLDSSEKYLILATAHPAKFPSVYQKASLPTPTSTILEELSGKKSKKYFIDPDPKAIRAFIEEHLD